MESLNTAPKLFPPSPAVASWACSEVTSRFFSKFNLPTVSFGGKCAGVGLRQTLCLPQGADGSPWKS